MYSFITVQENRDCEKKICIYFYFLKLYREWDVKKKCVYAKEGGTWYYICIL